MSKDIREDKNIVMRIKDILDELYCQTVITLKNSRDLLEKIAQELLLNETIDENDINRIINTFEAVS